MIIEMETRLCVGCGKSFKVDKKTFQDFHSVNCETSGKRVADYPVVVNVEMIDVNVSKPHPKNVILRKKGSTFVGGFNLRHQDKKRQHVVGEI